MVACAGNIGVLTAFVVKPLEAHQEGLGGF